MSRPDDDRVIQGVHVFSTGSAEVRPEHRYGTAKPGLWWVLTSRKWTEIPINAYVIEHREGLVLFDTGVDPALGTDPEYVASAVGRFFLRRLFRFSIGPTDNLASQLGALGFSGSDVRKVVVSHLHWDHIGGISHVLHADLLVSQEEWQQLAMPHPEREWFFREHIELPGAKWRPVVFSPTDNPLFEHFGGYHDVMGDGSLILLPTPGHTPGSMSMLVRDAGFPPLLLVGDLTYETDMLFRDQVPGTGNAEQLRSSFAKVRGLKEKLPSLVILPAHDPGAKEVLRKARQAAGEP
jgi:glyoxylase-like metal-dependent hydrolase (beta-lactamase superfamily II)